MNKLLILAALTLAAAAANAGEKYNFDVGGRTIHIDPDRGIVSIPGVYESGPKRAKRTKDDLDDGVAAKPAPLPPRVDAPATPAQQATPSTATVAPPASPPPSSANLGPADPREPERLFGPRSQPGPATSARLSPPADTRAPSPPPIQQASASATSPVGVWLTEEKEGKVRIEQCGANLCGYTLNERSDQNGEKVLIDMKPVGGKWSGKIHDPKSGSTYDSSISLKGSDGLRVQGCAFGGMFCGGQTWSRVN